MKRTRPFPFIPLAFFAFIGLLLGVRFLFSAEMRYVFLVWNLFLAWIPFLISGWLVPGKNRTGWKPILLFCCWLAFFPNALYIVTDLIHLRQKSHVPIWFDAVLLFSSSMAGVIMAFISLYRVEKWLHVIFGMEITTVLIIFLLFLGSFGVYLGRFLRWNSWDIITNPFQLIISIARRILSPIDHFETWGITFILTILFYLLYFALKKLPGYISQANV